MLNLTNTAALPEACAARGGTAAELAAGIHERLGVVLLNEVLSEPESVEARAFCKSLNALNLVPPELAEGAEVQISVDTECLATLSVLATNASAVVTNRFAKTALTKFMKDVSEITAGSALSEVSRFSRCPRSIHPHASCAAHPPRALCYASCCAGLGAVSERDLFALSPC